MSTLGWGIIGLGNIVNGTIAPAMVAEPECDVVAGVSRSQDRADTFAARFGARHAYTDYDEMLANPEVEAVFVATPNAQHVGQVLAAARAGKHVMCDKPMAITVADAVAEVEACREAGVKFGINFHNRHLPWVQDTKQLIADGVIGDVLTVQVEASAGLRPHTGWRNDPELAGLGTLYNVGVHVLDFLRVILGAEPVETVALFDDENGRFAVEIEALVLLRFDNGARVYVNFNQNNPNPQNDIAIYGTRGRITGKSVTRSRVDGELTVLSEAGETVTPYPSPGAHRRSVAAFTRAVLAGEEPNASGIDGLRSMELCDAIARSVRERRVVDVVYSEPLP